MVRKSGGLRARDPAAGAGGVPGQEGAGRRALCRRGVGPARVHPPVLVPAPAAAAPEVVLVPPRDGGGLSNGALYI